MTTQEVARLMEGIRKGEVPRQIRLFAAQGLLPVAREDLYRIQLLLVADPDEELAETARKSIEAEPLEAIIEWVRSGYGEPLELDMLARVRREEAVWAEIARSPKVSDETLRMLARYGGPLVQDIIVTNQVRLLACLELLEDLRSNPKVTPVVLRRVREFEEEFIEKAAARAAKEEAGEEVSPEEALPEPEPGPTIEEALAALKALGANVPAEDELVVEPPADHHLAKEAEAQGKSAFARLMTMNTHEKILRALKGTREERSILINSRNRLVVRAVLQSPKLSDLEVERYASSRSVSDEVIRIISSNPRWMRKYGIVLALASNPKTPVKTAVSILPKLNLRDLKKLAKDRNINPMVRKQASRLLERRG